MPQQQLQRPALLPTCRQNEGSHQKSHLQVLTFAKAINCSLPVPAADTAINALQGILA